VSVGVVAANRVNGRGREDHVTDLPETDQEDLQSLSLRSSLRQ
jgi:hypothetical protein